MTVFVIRLRKNIILTYETPKIMKEIATFFVLSWFISKQIFVHSNSVIMNSTGPRKSVCYNREIVITGRKGLCSKGTIWDQKGGVLFVRNSREFVITVIVITEFDFIGKISFR